MAAGPRTGRGVTPTRSVRIEPEVWERAKAQAEKDGMTLSTVMQRLLTAYADGKVEVPEVHLTYGAGALNSR